MSAPRFATLTEMLDAAARSDKSLIFVGRDETDHPASLSEIRVRAHQIAGGLHSRGVAAGDRVALVLPTGPEFVASFFGVLVAGAIPVPLYPPVRLAKLDEYHQRTATMLRAVQAALVITDARIRPALDAPVADAAPRLGCALADEITGEAAPSATASPDDIALIQFSSGTTHDPKPVALTHANLLHNLAALADYFTGAGISEVIGVTWLPLYHDMGLIGNLLSAFYLPCPLVLLPPELFLAIPGAWLRAISRHRGNVTAAPNFAFGLCVKRIRDDELDGVDLSSWTLCLNGAEMVNAEVAQQFSERFVAWGFHNTAMTPVYGLAEASLAVTFTPADAPVGTHRGVVSVGRPLAGVEVQIRDADSRPLPDDEVGRIVVRAPSVMPGYFNRPDLTAQVLADGWLDGGDLGFIHDGELFVTGRSKDTIIIRGANHAPQDFEAALDGLAGVRAGCAVAVGYPSADAGEEALAILAEVTPEATPELAADIAARVLDRTRITVGHVELVEPGALPRTSSGKMRRLAARDQWLAGTLPSAQLPGRTLC
ncbi:AMP-binding protein [Mycobacterium sp. M26]|uniref:AMP-binding protein n=1 Tax=Mycobacterium sp. M26 TaxID=1762962 RepID=UPI000A8052A8|nr:AMP-binding protein [Mycobacterium sp. M26]